MITASNSAPLQREAVNSRVKKITETSMPWDEVMSKFRKGKLHSGSKSGPAVKDKKQAAAIMLDEKQKAEGGKPEYQPHKKLVRRMATGGN